jgi:hypothetical protein
MHAFRRELPKLTDRLPLGTSGLEVSPFCLGLVGDPATVVAAYEAGINFFFLTADMHWPIYEQVRRGLELLLETHPDARDHIVLGVVCYVTQPEFCWAPYEEVLECLPQLKRVDLTIAGGAYAHEIEFRHKQYEVHRSQHHAGARAIGATFHERKGARTMIEKDAFDICYVRYNPLHPNARHDLFPHIKSRVDGRKGLVFNFKSTMGHITDEKQYDELGIGTDFWRPHVTDYYRFALAQPALDGLLVAFPGPHAVQDLADAMAKGPLDEEDHQYLLDLGELGRGAATLAKSA